MTTAVAARTATTTAGRSGRRRGGRTQRVAYLYLIPALLVMGIITLYPLIYQVWMSFTDYTVGNLRGTPPNWVGLQNYADVLQSALAIPNFSFMRLILYNIWWAVSNVAIHVVLGVAIALLLNSDGLKFKRFYRAMYILPVVIPPLIVATVWTNIYDADFGAVNLIFRALGGFLGMPETAFHTDWLRQVEDPISFVPLPMAYFAMLVTNTWLGWPLNSVVATGALQSIPRELYEAAEIDGAGSWMKFKTVTLTYLRPAMVPYAMYGFVVTFNLFYLAYFMSQGGPLGRTELLVTQAYRLVNGQQLFGVGASFAVIMFFLLLVITLITNRIARATASYEDL